ASAARWLGPLRDVLANWEFRRGLLEWVSLDAEAFVEHAEDMFRRGPVREADLEHVGRVLPDLLNGPHLRRLRGLSFGDPSVHGDHLGSDELAALATSPALSGLTAVSLKGHALHPEGVRVMTQAPWLAGLESLNVSGCRLGASGAEMLADCPAL